MTTALIDLLDVITKDRELPKGYDRWAIRSVHPDGASSRGFVWPLTPKVAKASGPFTTNSNPCPSAGGDGVCAAHTWRGMASGGVPAATLLLIAYRDADVLADSLDKVRLRKCRVVAVVAGARLVRESGRGADLRGADLTRADLTRADLRGADLTDADLTRADLRGADLTGADLTGADLTRADLTDADLTDAYLRNADLRGADLTDADLTRADLTDAYLRNADLTRAIGVNR